VAPTKGANLAHEKNKKKRGVVEVVRRDKRGPSLRDLTRGAGEIKTRDGCPKRAHKKKKKNWGGGKS